MQYIIKSNAFTCKMRAFKNVKQLCKSTSLVVDRSSDLLQPWSQQVEINPTHLNAPLSPVVNAPLKDPPMRISPSCTSSTARSLTGMGCRYTWKQLREFRVTDRVRTKSSEKRNTWSLCGDTWRVKNENSSYSEQKRAQEQLGDNVNSHQAALVAQLAVTEEALTAVYERVSLLVVQVL